MCLEVAGKLKEGPREEQKQAGAGVNELCQTQPNQITSTIPSNLKIPEGGMGGNGGKAKIASGATGQVLGMRHGFRSLPSLRLQRGGFMGRLWLERLEKNPHPNAQICTHASVDRLLIWSEQWVGQMQRLQCSLNLVLGRDE